MLKNIFSKYKTFRQLFALVSAVLVLMSLGTAFGHSSLMVDLERQYEARANWAESVDPMLSLVIMMESQSFKEDVVLKEAVKFLKGFESHYERVSLIFSDQQAFAFLPAERYGVSLVDGKVKSLEGQALRGDVKLVMAAGRARAMTTQVEHGHEIQ